MDPSSSSLGKKSTKLSVRNQTCFKRSCRTKNKTDMSLLARKETLLKKAKELSILCEIELCLIYYDRDGELTTYPMEQSKVRDIAERFSNLSVQEKRKKSTNISQSLKKKLEIEKKQSLINKDNKFLEKVLEMEKSLETNTLILEDRLRFLYFQEDIQTEIIPKNSTDLSSSSPAVVDHHHQPVMNHPSNETFGVSSDSSTSSNLPRNNAIVLYNHDNHTCTQLANSASSFEQPQIPYGYGNSNRLLGQQVIRGYNNIDRPMAIHPPLMQMQNPIDQFASLNHQTPICNSIDNPMAIPPPPPMMQTQYPIDQFNQFASWNHQTPSLENPSMFF